MVKNKLLLCGVMAMVSILGTGLTATNLFALDWLCFQNGIDHSGESLDHTVGYNFNQVWSFTGGNNHISQPLVKDGAVYFGNTSFPAGYSQFFAVDATTGKFLWSYTVYECLGTSAAPCIDGDVIYYVTLLGNVYALNIHTGALVWSSQLNYNNFSGAAAHYMCSGVTCFEGKVYFGSFDGSLYALNESDGSVAWSYDTGTSIESTPAIDVQNRRIFFGCNDAYLYCLNLDSHDLAWKTFLGSNVVSSPSLRDGMVYVGTTINGLFSLSQSDGSIQWQGNLQYGGWVFGSPATSAYKIVAASNDHYLYCFNRQTGAALWQTKCLDNFACVSPIIDCETTYVGGCVAHFYALDLENGRILSTVGLSDRMDCSPSISNGRIYMGCNDGGIYCFSTKNHNTAHPLCDTMTFTSTPTPTQTQTQTMTATITQTYTVTATPTITPTTTNTQTSTATLTVSPTATQTPTPTDTATCTVTWTARFTNTNTPTNTSSATRTQTVTSTPTIACPPAKITFVILTFNTDQSGSVVVQATVDGGNIDSVTATVYPQDTKSQSSILCHTSVTVTMGQVNGTSDLYRGSYQPQTGFGDIEKVIVTVKDKCGNIYTSDGTFNRQVISGGQDVKIKTNIFDPTNGETVKIQYSLYGTSPVEIKIMDQNGKYTQTVLNLSSQQEGVYQVAWDGRNSGNIMVGSGVYYVTIKTDFYKETKKVMVIK